MDLQQKLSEMKLTIDSYKNQKLKVPPQKKIQQQAADLDAPLDNKYLREEEPSRSSATSRLTERSLQPSKQGPSALANSPKEAVFSTYDAPVPQPMPAIIIHTYSPHPARRQSLAVQESPASSLRRRQSLESVKPGSCVSFKRETAPQFNSVVSQEGSLRNTELQREYVQMIERLQRENAELRVRMELKDKEAQAVRVKELEARQSVHDRIEQGLKDKIHQLQQEYYQVNREKLQKLDEEENLAARLSELQEALLGLERKVDAKEREALRLQRENDVLARELEQSEERRQDAMLTVQEQELLIGEMEQDIRDLHNDLRTVSIDCQFYKDKYIQMQAVVDGCSAQVREFDQVNAMSCDIIERLQSEVEFLKLQLETHCENKPFKKDLEILSPMSAHVYDEPIKVQQVFPQSPSVDYEPCLFSPPSEAVLSYASSPQREVQKDFFNDRKPFSQRTNHAEPTRREADKRGRENVYDAEMAKLESDHERKLERVRQKKREQLDSINEEPSRFI